jgi:hypothetical protein
MLPTFRLDQPLQDHFPLVQLDLDLFLLRVLAAQQITDTLVVNLDAGEVN